MSREKQIEEMAKTIYEQDLSYDTYYQTHCERLATDLYNAGYRKASDLAEEIFAEIEKVVGYALCVDLTDWSAYTELKKKYTEVAKRREDIENSPVDCSTPSVTDQKGERNEQYIYSFAYDFHAHSG